MFGKIFGQIFDSSIACSPALRHFFMDMIVLADADGDVDMTPESISARTRIPLDEVNQHLTCLCNPDPRSRTPDNEGRRLELLDSHRDWGWHIINYRKFREIATNEQRKASQRDRVNRYRSKQKESCNAPVTPSNACNARQRQRQRKGEEAMPPFPKVILSAAERITLEKERKELNEKISKFNGDYLSPSERVSRKALRDRIARIDAAMFIPLPPVEPSHDMIQ